MSNVFLKLRHAGLALTSHFRRPSLADGMMLLLLAGVILLITLAALFIMSSAAVAMPLSRGDRIHIQVESGEEFTGKYQVDQAGQVRLPYAGSIRLAGLLPEQAAEVVNARLVSAGLFKPGFVRTNLQVMAWAPLDVRVSGAVFYPGAHKINQPPSRERAPERAEDLPGAPVPERRLSDALRSSGGVTPWADLSHIIILRDGQTSTHNLWWLLQGNPGEDPYLQGGDEVHVPQLPQPNSALARPSSITPAGVKVFISNLIQPAMSNGSMVANLSFAYGSRFSQAVVAMNCVGGVLGTAHRRSAVLIRTDRNNGGTQNWESPVEQLIREGDAAINPVLLEGDAVACYDSTVTTVRDVFRTISEVLSPLSIFRRIP